MRRQEPLAILTGEEMRRIDSFTIEQCRVPSVFLMGNAGSAVYKELSTRFPQKTSYVGIFCGIGNNGGDGLAFALNLWKQGYRNFKLFVVSEDESKHLSPDAQFYLGKLDELGIVPQRITSPTRLPSEAYSVKVDALFGTGLSRNLSDFYQEVIRRFNLLSGFSIAIDCPSGLNATTGEIMGAAVKADLTVTMGYPKTGFFTASGAEVVGELAVHDIALKSYEEAGIKATRFYFPPEFFWKNEIPKRRRNVHKGDFGKVLVVAGSRGFSGAAKMVGRSAMRAGAGLVRLYVPFEIYDAVSRDLTEVMVNCYLPFGFSESSEGLERIEPELQWADVLAIGSGLSERQEMQEVAYAVVKASELPLIADAEGIIAVKRWLIETTADHQRLVLLTPHIGELAKLVDAPLEEVKKDPVTYSLEFAEAHKCYLLTKSSVSFLATPGGLTIYPPSGSPALAKGGSGDILVGTISARTAIAIKSALAGKSPYDGNYLSKGYYELFPMEIWAVAKDAERLKKEGGEAPIELAWIEGILRGYYLFADASHRAVARWESEESLLAKEIIEAMQAERN